MQWHTIIYSGIASLYVEIKLALYGYFKTPQSSIKTNLSTRYGG